jgi:hypothetical protein
MSAWQPIETAPTNGHVLLYCKETGEQFVAFLGTSIEEGDSAWIYARGRNVAFIVRNPTHWQQLPEAP